MSKSERAKQILYINACMICIMAGYSLSGLYDQSHGQSDSGCMHHTYIQNLGKQYWWTYLQRRNGDADVGNGLVDTAGEGEARTNWEGSIDVYTLTHSQSHSDVSDSLRPHGLQPARLLCPWDFPGKNTGKCSISFSMGSSQPRDQTGVFRIAGRFFMVWATREAPTCS